MGLETTTLMAIGAAVSAVGAGVGAYSSYASGQSQNEAAKYNAEMQRQAARDALQRGANEANDIKMRARRIISGQRAATAAQGFDTSTGTALDLSTEAAGFGELDALKTINNAQRQAAGMKAQANLSLYQGEAAAMAGMLNAGGTLFTGASNAFYGSGLLSKK